MDTCPFLCNLMRLPVPLFTMMLPLACGYFAPHVRPRRWPESAATSTKCGDPEPVWPTLPTIHNSCAASRSTNQYNWMPIGVIVIVASLLISCDDARCCGHARLWLPRGTAHSFRRIVVARGSFCSQGRRLSPNSPLQEHSWPSPYPDTTSIALAFFAPIAATHLTHEIHMISARLRGLC